MYPQQFKGPFAGCDYGMSRGNKDGPMAKRRSKSAANPSKEPAQALRAKKTPLRQHKKKPTGSATESLREEAERGWAKLDRQIARRRQRDLARATQKASAKILRRPSRTRGKTAGVGDRA